MITIRTRVVDVAPRISRAAFVRILQQANSPAWKDGAASYDVLVQEKCCPLFALAVFKHESNFGKLGICARYETKSPGNTRSSRTGAGVAIQTEQGQYIRYLSWVSGWQDLAYRLRDPSHVYVREGRVTIEQIIRRFAPKEDGNNPDEYISVVVKFMSDNADLEGTGNNKMPVDKPYVIKKPTPNCWRGRDGHLPVAIIDHVTVGSAASAANWFANPASEVSSNYQVNRDGGVWQYVADKDTAWANGRAESPDMAIGWLASAIKDRINPNRLTISIEHEGQSGQALSDEQYKSTLQLHRYLCDAYNIPADRQHITGHYSIDSLNKRGCPGAAFPWARLIGDLRNGIPEPEAPPVQPGDFLMVNGHVLGGGFYLFYKKYGSLRVLGLPLTEEYLNLSTGVVEMVFERYVLGYYPDLPEEWRVQGLHIGRMYHEQLIKPKVP